MKYIFWFMSGIILFLAGTHLESKASNDAFHSLTFDGVNDRIEIPDQPQLDLTANWTIESWVYLKEDVLATDYTIVSKGDRKIGGHVNYRINIVPDRTLKFEYWDGTAFYNVNDFGGDNITVEPNRWQHIAVTYDGSTMTFYNTTEKTKKSFSYSHPIQTDEYPLFIGARKNASMAAGYGNRFAGNISEVRIWQTVKSENELIAGAHSNATGTEVSLAGLWKLDDYTTGKVYDQTTYANHGVAGGYTSETGNLRLKDKHTNRIHLAWDRREGDAFELLRDGMPVYSGNALSYSDNTVSPNTNYTYSLKTKGALGESIPIIQTEKAEPRNNISFDGSRNYMDLGSILPVNSYTKEAWVYLTNQTGYKNILSGRYHAIWVDQGYLHAMHDIGGGFIRVRDPNPFPLNEWVHVAVTYDASSNTMVLYKNGSEAARRTDIPPITEKSTRLGIWTNINYFQGKMSEVRIWNSVKTQSEIQNNMHRYLSGKENNLEAYYPMDGIFNDMIEDRSLNKHDGKTFGYAYNQTRVQLGVSSGVLQLIAPMPASFPAVTLNNTHQTVTGSIGDLILSNGTGSLAGYRVQISGTQMETAGGKKLAAGSLQVTQPTKIEALENTDIRMAPNVHHGFPWVADNGVPFEVVSAPVDFGKGEYKIQFGAGTIQLVVPPDAYAGTYTSTLTWTISVAP